MGARGSNHALTVRPLTGGEIALALDALAALRIAVFRAYPYLYDGSAAYERAYLTAFAECPGAVLVAAFAGDAIVGAATGAPLSTQKPEFRAPFEAAGHDLADIFYFGESVLLPAWRGRGIGHAFFDHREAQARSAGAKIAAFCAVVRPPGHPARRPVTRRSTPSGENGAMRPSTAWSPVFPGATSATRPRRRTRCNSGCAASIEGVQA